MGSCSTEDSVRVESAEFEIFVDPGQSVSFAVHAEARDGTNPRSAEIGIIIDELALDGTLDVLVTCDDTGSGRRATLDDGSQGARFGDGVPTVATDIRQSLPIEVDCTAVFTAGVGNTAQVHVVWVAELALHYAGRKTEPDVSIDVEPA